MTPEQIVVQRLGELEWTICDLRTQLARAQVRIAELEADRTTVEDDKGAVYVVEKTETKAA